MDTIYLLFDGISNALSPQVLLSVFGGVVLGLIVGALPALGPAAGVAILLPLITTFDPIIAMAGLSGVYFGAMYGGAVASILLGIPGDSAAMMTVLDGHPLAKKGHAGRALGMVVYASFIGGFISIVLMTIIGAYAAQAAIKFGPVEMTSLIVAALCLVAVLGDQSYYKSFIALSAGLLLGVVGLDSISGEPRLTFGNIHLLPGIDFVVVVVGLYGIGQMFTSLARDISGETPNVSSKLSSLLPRWFDFVRCRVTLAASAILGFFVGIIPGAGATAATVFAYALAKRISNTPNEFGHGCVEGVAAPEAANNSAAYSAMVPLLTLGIPGSGTTAVMLGGLIMLGLEPGPLLFEQQPELVWTLIGTFYIGNIILVICTLALIPVLASIIFLRPSILFPVVISIVVFGIYSLNSSFADVLITFVFGVVGYILIKVKFPILPVVLGVILGPMLEKSVRQSLIISGGDVSIFAGSYLSIGCFTLAASLVIYSLIGPVVARRKM